MISAVNNFARSIQINNRYNQNIMTYNAPTTLNKDCFVKSSNITFKGENDFDINKFNDTLEQIAEMEDETDSHVSAEIGYKKLHKQISEYINSQDNIEDAKIAESFQVASVYLINNLYEQNKIDECKKITQDSIEIARTKLSDFDLNYLESKNQKFCR